MAAVAVVAVVTTVVQEGAEAHGAVGFEARTDDALPVHPDVSPVGHIYWSLSWRADLKSLTCCCCCCFLVFFLVVGLYQKFTSNTNQTLTIITVSIEQKKNIFEIVSYFCKTYRCLSFHG